MSEIFGETPDHFGLILNMNKPIMNSYDDRALSANESATFKMLAENTAVRCASWSAWWTATEVPLVWKVAMRSAEAVAWEMVSLRPEARETFTEEDVAPFSTERKLQEEKLLEVAG